MTSTQSALDEFDESEVSDVYVTTSTPPRVYHPDPECTHAPESHEPIPLEDAKERGLEVCSTCGSTAGDLCGAETKTGEPCQIQALAGFGRCVHHADLSEAADDSSPESDDRPVWERQREELIGEP